MVYYSSLKRSLSSLLLLSGFQAPGTSLVSEPHHACLTTESWQVCFCASTLLPWALSKGKFSVFLRVLSITLQTKLEKDALP